LAGQSEEVQAPVTGWFGAPEHPLSMAEGGEIAAPVSTERELEGATGWGSVQDRKPGELVPGE